MFNKTEKEIMKNWIGDINNPLVSIKCTAYNHELYIKDALDGFLMQETTFPFEVIVHDDASTDNTANIIKEYEKKYPNIIKPIYETENQYSKHDGSISKIINNKIKGKYVALCEGDDYWIDNSKLEKQANALEKNDNCSISYCYVNFVDVNGLKKGYCAPPKGAINNDIVTLEDFLYVEFMKCHWCFHTSSFMFRASLLNTFEIIRKNEFKYFPYGDMSIQLWCLLNGNGYLVKEEMSCYRQDSGGYNTYIKKHPNKYIEDELSLIKALNSFDSYTNRKFHKYIKSKCRRERLIIMSIGRSEKEFILETLKPINWKEVGIRRLTKNFIKLVFRKY